MRAYQVLLLWPNLLILAACATIKPAAALDIPSSLSASNATVHGPPYPDPHFSLQPHYTNTRLPATAILMNTVTLLSEAADLDYDSPIDYDKHSIFDEYPAVAIDLKMAKTKMKLRNFLLIWALYEAAWDMVSKNGFFVCEFDIVWWGRVVAKLRYSKAPEMEGGLGERIGTKTESDNETGPSIKEVNSAKGKTHIISTNRIPNETEAANITIATASSSLVAPPNNPYKLLMQYMSDGKNIPIFTVFMTILAIMKDNAFFPANAPVQPFTASTPGFDARMTVMRNRGPPITQPPFFERTTVTHGMRQLLIQMLREGKFAELAFTISIDGKE